MESMVIMDDREQSPLLGANTSGLNRLRVRLEKSTPSLSRKLSSSLQGQPKRTSIFTKPSSISLHRRQRSVDEIIHERSQLNISKSRSLSPKKPIMNQNINESPVIETVSNFSSPTKSILSDNSDGLSPVLQPQRTSNLIPKIDVTEPQSPPPLATHALKEPSPIKSNGTTPFGRFRRKTLSMFFDQGSNSISHLTPVSPADKTTESSSQSLQRPKLSKSHSDNDRTQTNANDKKDINTAMKLQQDLTRKRSKTMGSVENDLYHKRNGSIVKTIGSLMMLKPKQSHCDSSASVSQTSLSLDSDPLSASAPPSPPELQDDEAPENYIQALKDVGFDFEITSILSASDAPHLKECLDCFIAEKFDFNEIPLDIALRMFLMFCELPPEAQQIDRVLESFSYRYYQCNIGLWDNPDQVYFLTFSLVMLHTDYYNVNNKRKMTREDFVKNTRVEDDGSTSNSFLTKEILEYFYENTIYTKFVKRYQMVPQHSPQNLYTLPKRLFSSASSNNLDTFNQQANFTSSPNLRSQSFSSTTSQIFSSAPVIDPYQMILSHQLDLLKIDVSSINYENPFKKTSNGLQFEVDGNNDIVHVREQLLSKNGLYIRYNKDCNWLTSKTEIKFKTNDEVEYGKRVLLKVIKAAEIYREETVTNSKFFTIGSTSKVIWKKHFGILTTCGFFLFDTLNFLSIPERQKVFSGDYKDEPFVVEILLDFILRSCEKYSINGLFASSPRAEEEDLTFNIYSTNKKEKFSVNTREELSSWISSINYIAALDSCFIDKLTENNHEVHPLRTTTMEDKITKLERNKDASLLKVQYYLQVIQHIKLLAPFSQKTRENLVIHYKALGIKIDWLWYEIERNLVYTEVLRRELIIDDTFSARTNDETSFLEESFINDDYYRSQQNKNYSIPPLKLANDSLESFDQDDDSDEAFVDASE